MHAAMHGVPCSSMHAAETVLSCTHAASEAARAGSVYTTGSVLILMRLVAGLLSP